MVEFQHGCRISSYLITASRLCGECYASVAIDTPLLRQECPDGEIEVRKELAKKGSKQNMLLCYFSIFPLCYDTSIILNLIEAFTSITPLQRDLWYHHNLFKPAHTGPLFYEGMSFIICYATRIWCCILAR